jgi:c-di-GMP-binding flagellar brake protein YcgR
MPLPANPTTASRQFSRFCLDSPVVLKVQRDNHCLFLRGRSLDVSLGGLSFVTGDSLHDDERVVVAFTLPPTEQQIKVDAVVRRKNGYVFGLEFVSLSAAQRQMIDSVCRMYPRAA